MNRLGSLVLCVALAAGPFAAPVAAVSVDDLINLKAHGLSDQLLIELIDTSGSSFQLTADDVVALHTRGLSDTVLRAMIRTGRPVRAGSNPAPPVPTTAPAPPVVVVSVPVSVAVPVYVPVVVDQRPRVPAKAPEPVYWGFGGKLRPDAWKPAPEPSGDKPAPSSAKSR